MLVDGFAYFGDFSPAHEINRQVALYSPLRLYRRFDGSGGTNMLGSSELRWYFAHEPGMRSNFEVMARHGETYKREGKEAERAKHTNVMRVSPTKCFASLGFEAELDDIARRHDVRRRLNRVRDADPIARQALELYHGDAGERWAQAGLTRAVALFAMTRAGRRLLEHLRSTAEQRDLSNDERLQQALTAKGSVTSLLVVAAYREAGTLQQRTEEAWQRADIDQVPVVLAPPAVRWTMSEVAERLLAVARRRAFVGSAVGSAERVRRYLSELGALIQCGGRPYTTPDLLLARDPSLYDVMMQPLPLSQPTRIRAKSSEDARKTTPRAA